MYFIYSSNSTKRRSSCNQENGDKYARAEKVKGQDIAARSGSFPLFAGVSSSASGGLFTLSPPPKGSREVDDSERTRSVSPTGELATYSHTPSSSCFVFSSMRLPVLCAPAFCPCSCRPPRALRAATSFEAHTDTQEALAYRRRNSAAAALCLLLLVQTYAY
jgi:hypothetical protein